MAEKRGSCIIRRSAVYVFYRFPDRYYHIKKKGYGVYPALLWALSATVNKFEEFRTCKDKDGNLGYYDMLWPSYTVFNEERKTFSVTCTEYDVDFGVFFNRYKADSAAAKKAGTF